MFKLRTKGQTTGAFVIGLGILIAISVLSYLFGGMQAASTSFKSHAGFALENAYYKELYFKQVFSGIVAVVLYAIAFWQAKGKADKHGSMTRGGDNYVLKNWMLFALIAGVVTVLAAMVLFNWILFNGESSDARATVIKYNLWLVWTLQGVLTIGTFYLPFCNPFKKA